MDKKIKKVIDSLDTTIAKELERWDKESEKSQDVAEVRMAIEGFMKSMREEVDKTFYKLVNDRT